MPTVIDLVGANKLVRLTPHLDLREQEERIIWGSPEFVRWLQDVLPGLSSDWNLELSPMEQFIEFHSTFATGECLTYGNDLNPLFPHDQSVWELKTADVRVFGWFFRQDCFIAHRGDQASHVKRHKLYRGYVGEVSRFRDNLDLDNPKFLAGVDPRDVVSNFSL